MLASNSAPTAVSRSPFFFFSSRRRHTRLQGDWSSDVCSSDLDFHRAGVQLAFEELQAKLGTGVVIPFTARACFRDGLIQDAGNLRGRWRQQEIKEDRKSTRLNSSHLVISYAVFCLKTKMISKA